ncbi:cystathionine beta-lyase [Pseudomonas cuatrocienegasensis]|uniref:Cystathionine beta-lyase n=1 Tax=Pseudomonas cuatrocienegasensis TaxID=543360 RepID=A0ABY1B9Z4_9PSED|nr:MULTISPECIES: cystathionine beta-lyase [Pseudomonas]OEC35389.1 cystathionine beta-lyase [Pseudomonas sp. 21C1]SEQ34376.1 cystathionine beta-lyase [Pseudomonas cuatrocienegasensis]
MAYPDTQIISTGRTPERFAGMVNTPVFRGSTILAKDFESWETSTSSDNPYSLYCRFGTPTTQSLETAMAELEGGYASLVYPSGLSACTHALLAFVTSGGHALLSDNIYGPTRHFADHVLTRLGVQVSYFDPSDLQDLEKNLRATTQVVFVESPGSLTFEIGDISAIAARTHSMGAYLLLDNTWASPLYFKPFEHAVDVSVHSATKYIVGHSDALLGVATANARAWDKLRSTTHACGETAGADDVYLALRGLRSMAVRLRQHWQNGLALAEDLQQHAAIAQVHHPALPSHRSYALWQRDFLGASGLFSFELKRSDHDYLQRFFDALQHFGIGLSWGGYESLVLPVGTPLRSTRPWSGQGYLVRLHAGLEDLRDLQADLHRALDLAEATLTVSVASNPTA